MNMLMLLPLSLPLGEIGGSRSLGKQDAVPASTVLWICGAVVVVAFVAWLVVRSFLWLHRRYRRLNRWALFGELCRAHALNRGARRIVRQVAERGGLAHPALVFADPRCWDTESLASDPTIDLERAKELSARLFDRGERSAES
jgi:hypothetical protein